MRSALRNTPGESPFSSCSKACFRFLFFELNWSCFFLSCAIPSCQILDQRMQVSLLVLTSTVVSYLKAPSSSSPIGELSGEEDPIQKKEEKPTYPFAWSQGQRSVQARISSRKSNFSSAARSVRATTLRAGQFMSSYLRPRFGLLLLCCCYSSSNLYTSQGFSKLSTSKVGEERVISGWTQYLLSCHFPFSKSFASNGK